MEGAADPSSLVWVVVVAALAMLYMAWGIGANDVANAFGPAFGARCLTIRQACIIAAVCECTGAVLMGAHVSDTIRKGMMSVNLYSGDDGRVLVLAGMTSVLIAAATWLLVASKCGLPVSTTHSAVGGVIAFAVSSKGYESVNWEKVGMIIASWFISPLMSAFVGCVLYVMLRRLVLQHPDSLRRAQLAAPICVFFVTFVVALFTIYKGGKGLGLHKTSVEVAVLSSGVIACVFAAISYPFVRWWAAKVGSQLPDGATEKEKTIGADKPECGVGRETCHAPCPDEILDPDAPPSTPTKVTKSEDVELGKVKSPCTPSTSVGDSPTKVTKLDDVEVVHTPTEQVFTGFVVIIAGFFSLAHGANDVANSVGPFGAVLAAFDGPLQKKSEIPLWVFIAAGVMIVVGLATYGVHVMNTIGGKITPITPPKAFVVNFSATLVVLFATRAGIPISTTHASVGAVVGVGIAEGMQNVNWKVMGKVFLSWILTLPIVGITASGIFALLLPCMVDVPFATIKS